MNDNKNNPLHPSFNRSSGGAIYTTYSSLTIEGTNFLNNSASSGGALKAYQSQVRACVRK